MTRISQLKRGKVEEHGQAVGVPSPDDVTRRAREIARIDGRTTPTSEDRERAGTEVLGADLPATVTEDEGTTTQSLSRDPSDPPADRGHQTPEYVEQDEKEAVERLALEGVEEAQHDQMVQAGNPAAETDTGIGAPRDETRRRRGR